MEKKKVIVLCTCLFSIIPVAVSAYVGNHRITILDSSEYIVVGKNGAVKQVASNSAKFKTTSWTFIAVPGKESVQGHQLMAGGLCLSLTNTTAVMTNCSSPATPDQIVRLYGVGENAYQIKRAEVALCLAGDGQSIDVANRKFITEPCDYAAKRQQFYLPPFDSAGNTSSGGGSSSFGEASASSSGYTGAYSTGDLNGVSRGNLTVLQYLKKLSGHGIVGGLMRKHKDMSVENTVIQDAAPAKLGFYSGDFGFGGSASTSSRNDLMGELINQYKQGVVVQLMYHACIPTKAVNNVQETQCSWGDGGGVMPSHLDDGQWNDLITEGGNLNRVWKGRLDLLAQHFKTLQAAGVQVLFRPFHEMNQGAFWWGGRPGPQGTARLYELTREYLQNAHQLTNIIWVWDMQDMTAPSTWASYAPRDQYWDIGALDMYSGGYKQENYTTMLSIAKGKPIAIGEAFKIPSPSELAAQPQWVFFMGWPDPEFLSNNSADQIKSFYSHAIQPVPDNNNSTLLYQ